MKSGFVRSVVWPRRAPTPCPATAMIKPKSCSSARGRANRKTRPAIRFVGKSGKLLTSELRKIGITRDQVFITNIVKCRPPGNRNPLADEIAACNDWLSAQIALVEPKFIVVVGGPSLNTLVSKDLRITKARSNVFSKDGILFIPILHPAAALRSPDTMKLFLEDLANLKDFLSREIAPDEITEVHDKPAPPTKAEMEEDGGTLSLF